ncbi:MAG: ParB/RepB/Spo0J family partition protein [Planctomycetota bacterium]|nr:ParB/RepB/Spo0J family partition protein [Planctomycetota bacterium]
MGSEKRLGRGLESLVGGEQRSEALVGSGPGPGERRTVDITQLDRNPFQPRKEFAESELKSLADSIKTQGLLQPLLVRQKGERFEIIAGERRWRAAAVAGLREVPVVVKLADDQKMLEIALIENTQRKDLNPIEKALAFRDLMAHFHLTQEAVAERVSMERPTVANFVRLLDLPAEVQACVSRETISQGHARALLGLADPVKQIALAERIKKEQLSVRNVENIVRRLLLGQPVSKKQLADDPVRAEWEDKLRRRLGTKVQIRPKNAGGEIAIEFYSLDDFARISAIIGVR